MQTTSFSTSVPKLQPLLGPPAVKRLLFLPLHRVHSKVLQVVVVSIFYCEWAHITMDRWVLDIIWQGYVFRCVKPIWYSFVVSPCFSSAKRVASSAHATLGEGHRRVLNLLCGPKGGWLRPTQLVSQGGHLLLEVTQISDGNALGYSVGTAMSLPWTSRKKPSHMGDII